MMSPMLLMVKERIPPSTVWSWPPTSLLLHMWPAMESLAIFIPWKMFFMAQQSFPWHLPVATSSERTGLHGELNQRLCWLFFSPAVLCSKTLPVQSTFSAQGDTCTISSSNWKCLQKPVLKTYPSGFVSCCVCMCFDGTCTTLASFVLDSKTSDHKGLQSPSRGSWFYFLCKEVCRYI